MKKCISAFLTFALVVTWVTGTVYLWPRLKIIAPFAAALFMFFAGVAIMTVLCLLWCLNNSIYKTLFGEEK